MDKYPTIRSTEYSVGRLETKVRWRIRFGNFIRAKGAQNRCGSPASPVFSVTFDGVERAGGRREDRVRSPMRTVASKITSMPSSLDDGRNAYHVGHGPKTKAKTTRTRTDKALTTLACGSCDGTKERMPAAGSRLTEQGRIWHSGMNTLASGSDAYGGRQSKVYVPLRERQ